MSYDTATPYIASYIIFRDGDKIALLLRGQKVSWMQNHYGLPAGKVEKDEPYLAAAVREAKEEVGVDIDESELQHVLTMHRQEVDEDMEWVDVFFEAQTWHGELHNAEPHVHDKLEWFELNKLPENTISSVKFALEQIRDGNMYCQYGWAKR